MGAEELKLAVQSLYDDGLSLATEAFGGDEPAGLDLFRYQKWYTHALSVFQTLAPDRLPEFRRYYEADAKRKSLDVETYTLQDYFRGLLPLYGPNLDRERIAADCFVSQMAMLKSLVGRIDDVIGDIEGTLLAGMQDAELENARTLLRISPRAAGSLAGVVLETHLQKLARNRGVVIRKKHPTIADLNDPLKQAGVYDVVCWRKVTFLGDIRNLCSHKKASEPTREQVQELIDGVNWAIKSL